MKSFERPPAPLFYSASLGALCFVMWAILAGAALAAGGVTVEEDMAHADALRHCIASVEAEFLNQKAAAEAQQDKQSHTVENILAQRTLEEDYCLHSAECLHVLLPNEDVTEFVHRLFSSCLEAEAVETHSLQRRK
jgi:hypothetical protein